MVSWLSILEFWKLFLSNLFTLLVGITASLYLASSLVYLRSRKADDRVVISNDKHSDHCMSTKDHTAPLHCKCFADDGVKLRDIVRWEFTEQWPFPGSKCLCLNLRCCISVHRLYTPGERPEAYRIFDFYVSFSIAYFIGDTMMCIVLFENYGPGFLFHALSGLIGIACAWSCFGTDSGFSRWAITFTERVLLQLVNTVNGPRTQQHQSFLREWGPPNTSLLLLTVSVSFPFRLV